MLRWAAVERTKPDCDTLAVTGVQLIARKYIAKQFHTDARDVFDYLYAKYQPIVETQKLLKKMTAEDKHDPSVYASATAFAGAFYETAPATANARLAELFKLAATSAKVDDNHADHLMARFMALLTKHLATDMFLRQVPEEQRKAFLNQYTGGV